MADWEEIKRLAADFQRTQTIDTLNRISERNCIDIIKKLVELNYIEIIYSCDGKELVTPQQLQREIEDEVYRNGGRMHIHELAAKLNVDYQHVEEKANQLVKTNPEYNLILGQVIHSIYKNALAKRINDKLLLEGQLSISEFSKSLDLPSDYLLDILEDILKNVSSEIVLSQDRQTVYTAETIDKYKAIIVGTLNAIIKPTSIASLIKRLDISERILVPTVEGLIKEGSIDASIENKQFIPALYARQQNEYINRFYSANSYIEYDVLSRMDIKQPKIFLKKKFPDGIQLKTCFISPLLVSQVESILEETISSNGWLDVSTVVPTSFDVKDIEEIIAIVFKQSKQMQSSSMIFDNTYVCSHGYIEICKRLFDGMMTSKAQDDLKRGRLVEFFMTGKTKAKTEKPPASDKKKLNDPTTKDESAKNDKGNTNKEIGRNDDPESSDEDDYSNKRSKSKKNKGAGGAASQGREVKQKNVKKKYFVSARGSKAKGGDDLPETGTSKRTHKQSTSSQSEAPADKLIFQEQEDLATAIQRQTSDDCSDEFLNSIVSLIQEDLDKNYEKVARQVLDEFLKKQEQEQQDEVDKQETVDDTGKDDDPDETSDKENIEDESM